jgi:hypothetical protein
VALIGGSVARSGAALGDQADFARVNCRRHRPETRLSFRTNDPVAVEDSEGANSTFTTTRQINVTPPSAAPIEEQP